MTPTLELLYIGTRNQDELEDIVSRGAVIKKTRNVYDGIACLKRSGVSAALVEFDELNPIDDAIAGLRAAAGSRPVLISMTTDEWEAIRGDGVLEQEEVLLRPYYPDELWRRVQRTALPAPAKAVEHFRNDADRLAAIIADARRLNRFTNDLRAFADHCVAIVKARMRANRVTLFLRGREAGVMTVADGAGIDRDVLQKAHITIGEGVAGEATQRKHVVIVQKAGKDGPSAGRDYAGDSYLIAPLVYEAAVVGVICVTDRIEQGAFDDGDFAYMEAFAEMAGQVAHNALQYRAADELATIDEGTQLFNRRHFNRVFPQEVIRAKRYKHDLTLALLDVDHFKLYNDSNGHQAGDHALTVVARALGESFRSADIIVRYGGEEFAVIMPETNRKEGNGVGFVDRARIVVAEAGLKYEDEHGNTRTLTISGGVATLPLQANSWQELFEKADKALYKAKASGRNRIVGS